MIEVSIAVRLKAPDPAAMTALSTLKRINPDTCPGRLERYDYWQFINPSDGKRTVEKIVSHFHDIVNPNKQYWSFSDESGSILSGNEELVWTEVLVTDKVDSISENWTDILRRNKYEVEKVMYSVLWRLGYPSGTSMAEARERTLALTITSYRDHGLLANPISQNIHLLDQA
ncbi:MAG: hypothetical protein KAT47_01545 [Candidatus Aegiribacteria sp.]|nr:hypothetical protein [Candidatus Aegiribacteria sp.]